MKKFFVLALALASTGVFATSIELPDTLTTKQIEDVSSEFAVNLSHTAVAAPETEGIWGVEVGLIAGKTASPELADLIDETGEDGSDFKTIYHAGLMARAHFPLDLFAEMTTLPEREVSDVTIKNGTFGLGWNAGAFFNLPLDLAIGANFSNSEVTYSQVINNPSTGSVAIDSEIQFAAKTRVLYVGVSKKFLFFTPYAKIGTAKYDADVEVDAGGTSGTIFVSGDQKESVSGTGGYYAIGANLQFLLLRFGFEASRTLDIGRVSGKLSLAF